MAASKEAGGFINAKGILDALVSVRPGTSMEEVYKRLGEPSSVSGGSHQWWIVEIKSDGKNVLSDGSLLYDIRSEDGKTVLFPLITEIWSTEKKAYERVNSLIRELAKEYGEPLKNKYGDFYWGFEDDGLLLLINVSQQRNGKYYILFFLMPDVSD